MILGIEVPCLGGGLINGLWLVKGESLLGLLCREDILEWLSLHTAMGKAAGARGHDPLR